MPNRTRRTGVALALLSATGFSTLGIFAELLYARGFSVPQTLAWRFTFASGFLAIVLALQARGASARAVPVPGAARAPLVPAGKLFPLILLGLFGFAPQAGMFFLTVRLLDPGITSLLLYLYPSFVLLLSMLFLRRRPTLGQGAALLLSLAGCLLTFYRTGRYPVAGLALGVAVAVAYAGYLVWGEKVLAGVNPVAATAVIMACAAVVYWGFVLISGVPVKVPPDLAAWGAVAGVAVVATVLPITTLFSAIGRIGASDASLASTIEPVMTVLLSALLFGERLSVPQAIGGALILAAVATLHFAPSDEIHL